MIARCWITRGSLVGGNLTHDPIASARLAMMSIQRSRSAVSMIDEACPPIEQQRLGIRYSLEQFLAAFTLAGDCSPSSRR